MHEANDDDDTFPTEVSVNCELHYQLSVAATFLKSSCSEILLSNICMVHKL
jgi:hypothetical protein